MIEGVNYCLPSIHLLPTLQPSSAYLPATPIPFMTVVLNTTGIAPAYKGCLQNGQLYGQEVRSNTAGITEARGLYD